MLIRGIMLLVVVVLATVSVETSVYAAADSFGTKNKKEDPYQKQLLAQIEKIGLTSEQVGPFKALMSEYFKMRNGAIRRISRQGGDLDVKVLRDLRRCARQALEDMAKVLTAEQLSHYEKLVEIGNEQYMMNAGLL
jgi:hypothetical protein